MNWKSQDNEAHKGKHVFSIESYFPRLMVALKYSRMFPSEFCEFSMIKIAFLTGLVVTFTAIIFINLISEIAVIIVGVNGDQIADVISVSSTHALGIVKWYQCTINNRKIFNIVNKLERCHVLCQRVDSTIEGNELYKKESERARRHCNLFFLWWFFICNFAVTQWVVAPLLLGTHKIYLINDTFTERGLPYIAWFPLDTYNIHNYIFLYVIQAIGMYFCIIGMAICDSFYVSMLILASIQLRYINTTLIKSHLIEDKRGPEGVHILERKLRNSADFHVEIIEFLNMLQIFASPIMFAQCIETLCVICLVSFQAAAIKLSTNEDDMFALFKMTGYLSSVAAQLWFFCFFATQITHLALQIPHSVYSCGWEVMIFEQKEQSSTSKQLKYNNINVLVQMIMRQAQRPIILTGGPFYTLSVETFRAIFSMAISNSVMLRQLSDQDE